MTSLMKMETIRLAAPEKDDLYASNADRTLPIFMLRCERSSWRLARERVRRGQGKTVEAGSLAMHMNFAINTLTLALTQLAHARLPCPIVSTVETIVQCCPHCIGNVIAHVPPGVAIKRHITRE